MIQRKLLEIEEFLLHKVSHRDDTDFTEFFNATFVILKGSCLSVI